MLAGLAPMTRSLLASSLLALAVPRRLRAAGLASSLLALAVPRRLRAAGLASSLLALAVLGSAAACGNEPAPTDVASDVDRTRAQFLADERVVRSALGQPVVMPGVVHNDLLGWNRTEVTARVYSSEGGVGPTPEAIEREVTAAVTMLRNGGWTIHWQMCLPEPEYDVFGGLDEEPIPMDVPRMPGYEWLVSGYKITDGVSYWVLIAGALIVDGTGFVDVILRAPNARDSANVFPVEPDPVAADRGCAEDGAVATAIEQVGTPTMMRDWWPFPTHEHSPDPHLV